MLFFGFRKDGIISAFGEENDLIGIVYIFDNDAHSLPTIEFNHLNKLVHYFLLEYL